MGIQGNISELRKRFMEYVWKAHLSQPYGIPLHKCKGELVVDANCLVFLGTDKDTGEPSETHILWKKITEIYLGWDDTLRRWRDTRAGTPPIRVTFRDDGKDRVLYFYCKEADSVAYGKENRRLYEVL
jgi:hypothetical protein